MSRSLAATMLVTAFVLSACTSRAPSPSATATLIPATQTTPSAAPTTPLSTVPVTSPSLGQPSTLPATLPASVAPSASPGHTQTFPAGSMIVTFDVAGEMYRVLLTAPQTIAIAQQLLAGEEAPSIPNGIVVRGDPSVNTGWTWHIDPASLEFADITTEVCDGRPSFVEQGLITGNRFCPWSAEVVAIERANP